MDFHPSVEGSAATDFESLWADGERVFCKTWRADADGCKRPVLAVSAAGERPTPASLARLAHEFELRNELDADWAVRPLELVRERGRNLLILEFVPGQPLHRFAGQPMAIDRFLAFAIGLTVALGRMHERGIVHKDIKPANVLIDTDGTQVRLMGFGIASHLTRERQLPEPPAFVAGTLPYMAPEQTGRMNRSIDSRSDLYSLGVTLYEMLTGTLPFNASDPTEWLYCHLARQPSSPSERSKSVPAAISAIIMKLLAKAPEERYQTAHGAEHDLRRCIAEWQACGSVREFALGEQDVPERLYVSEKLYGRQQEVKLLNAAFDHMSEGGAPELILVSGYSGIGKSSVVNELQSRKQFASGKCDQYKRDIPYATLAEAFQKLIRALLSLDEADLAKWRNAFCAALGENAALMVDLLPDLKLVIGEHPPVSDLPPHDAQVRFQLVFGGFIGVFAQPEHPLVLFLDDLQWVDAATLDLLQYIVTKAEVRHLMMIGAYRHNEVDADHPLRRKLDTWCRTGVSVRALKLKPLAVDDARQLIADTFHCDPRRAAPLAQLVCEKTAGNPFFTIQFIHSLADEGFIEFDRKTRQWNWDLDRIRAKGYTDNVAELMIRKLGRLPHKTRRAVQHLACVGHCAGSELELVFDSPIENVRANLSEAARMGLLLYHEDSYRFAHDRVQEAAYASISEEAREHVHLRIGWRLAAAASPEQREAPIFEIVNQLNRAARLITAQDERERLAEFNLIAGNRAKASAAYSSALVYFSAGRALIDDECWDRSHELIFQLELHQAECEFVCGQSSAASERLSRLSSHTANITELATVACVRVDLYTALDRSDLAIEVCLAYLRHLGVQWSSHPEAAAARHEYDQICTQLGGRSIESLIDLPMTTDPATLATLDVLTRVVPSAMFIDANLGCLAIARAVNISLQHGNSDASCFVYVYLGMVAGPHFGNYQAGLQFGQLGYDLAEKRGLKRFQVRTWMCFASHVMPWTQPLRQCRGLIEKTFDVANRVGDLCFAAFSCNNLVTNLLASGDPLSGVQRETECGIAFAQRAQFGLVIDILTAQLALIRTLRGLTREFGSFDDDEFDELRFEQHLASSPMLALPECFYWTRKLQARVLAGDYASAIHAASNAQRLLWAIPSNFEMAEYHFYGGLAHAATCGPASAAHRRRSLEALSAHHRQLSAYASNCAENFEASAALLGAEIARLEGRDFEAMHLYELAIRAARASGLVHHEALANEFGSRFYAAAGFENTADLYWREARYSYSRWGADGKVRQLDALCAHVQMEPKPRSVRSDTIDAPIEYLDLATVMKVAHAVSVEIVPECLIETIMRTAIEHAGAEQGLLLLDRGDGLRVEAHALSRGGTVAVDLTGQSIRADHVPKSLIQYVARTQSNVILDDASRTNQFSGDPYFELRRVRAVLCLPLIKQGQLTGALYLENNLTANAFTADRVAVLKLLASQAAISIENSLLYEELQRRELRIRRLVEANIVGIFLWKLDGEIIETNDAFLRMLGYDRDDFLSRRLRWTQLTPEQWRERDERALVELQDRGACEPFEKEFIHKNGGHVPVLVGGALLDGKRDEGVAFVVDLTERRNAEETLRETERRFHEAHMELMRANRLTTMGQLTASIAHEVRQPLAAAVTSAVAGVNWLSHDPPDVENAREALRLVVKDGHRAADVVSRIRGLVNNVPPPKERLDINEIISEVVALMRAEAKRNEIELRLSLASGLPLVLADRIQIQQVMLNLGMNAIEAMSSTRDGAREIVVRSEPGESNDVVVEVCDSGPGMMAGDLGRVFEAFFTTKPAGMGMGLSICRSIVEAHGGRIWATANAPRGAVFAFSLPAST